MEHLIFLYLILSCMIGLPSMAVLILAFLKSRLKILLYILSLLLLSTLQLAYVTYIDYLYANDYSLFTNYDDLINYILLCFPIIILPLTINELFKISRRKLLNTVFGGLFSISLALVLSPLFMGVIGRGHYISNLPNGKILLGICIFICLYMIFVFIIKFRTISNPSDRFFWTASVICLLIETSQFIKPIYRNFWGEAVVHAAVYFFWNVSLLKYTISKFFLESFPNSSLREVINGLALTEREKEILYFLAQGQTNRKIGAELFITEDTVKTHLKKIYRKLGVNNRIQLFNLLKENKL